ncbi:MAG: glycosyltransferase, partial [Candidatus Woesearchaeota archaeon]|nr:glycosyltransferase [Candidatus Woesearchaeota archaeon]
MKELLIATDSFLPRWDGVARFLSEVIPRLSGSYKITVVAPDFRGRKIKIPKVRIVRIPLQKRTIGDYTPSILDLRKIKRLVETSDIIFTQSIGPIGGPAVYYGQKLKKKVVAFMHSVEWELVSKSVKKYKKSTYHIVKRFARYLYRRCNVVIVPSHHIKTDLEQENIKTKTRIIHVGTDSGWFKPGIKSKAKKKLGIKGDRFVIGFVGRVGREKNLETLEKAFFKLRKKYDHLELLIVGTGLKEDIQRLRKKGVRVMGSQDHVLPFY